MLDEDYYEVFNEVEDKFDEQFEDDLDVLRELEEEESKLTQKHKRKLEFETPKGEASKHDNLKTNELEPCAKKPKVQESNSSPILPEHSSSLTHEKSDEIASIPKPIKSKKLVFGIDVITVTSYEGNRIYLKLKPNEECDCLIPKRKGHLLGLPYRDLWDQVEKDRERKLLNHSGGLKLLDDTGEFHLDEELSDNQTEVELDNEQLWVEKFKPKQYTELLSDDGINRSLLCWLKQWDKVVFGTEVSVKFLQLGKNNFKNKDTVPDKVESLDELNRPFFKVALLCGPPGLGKTTLAYIIAKHAGYNVVEMNASDDRSPEIFKKQLEASTQMRSVLGGDPKPNCLIIDEIDGAPTPAINVLVNFIKAIRVGKKKTPVLLRPIICICNDLYTPSLRLLRQIGFVLTFPPTASVRLASRLISIATKEHMKTDRNALLALCEKTENDIRSCLATMQFLRSLKKVVKIRDILSSNIGQKDIQQSIFNVWQCIFQIPRAAKKMPGIDLEFVKNNIKDETSVPGRFSKVLKAVQSYGEYDKIMQGVFENYPDMNFKDPLMENICDGIDCFSDMDLFQKQISQTQIYSLLPYMPYFIVKTHFLFSTISHPKLKYPNSMQECKNKETQLRNIVSAMTIYVSPMVRSFNTFEGMVLQLLPYLPVVIQPTLRPVNTQLFSDREKAEMRQVIQVMLAYNLVYRQERSVDGIFNYVLEPNIEELTRFSDSKVTLALTYAMKNIITRELEMEKMRRSEGTIGKKVEEKKEVPNFKQKLKPKVIEIKEKIATDFFGRTIAKPVVVKVPETSLKTGDIWFHFKEGYSNAVRRTVLMKDLL